MRFTLDTGHDTDGFLLLFKNGALLDVHLEMRTERVRSVRRRRRTDEPDPSELRVERRAWSVQILHSVPAEQTAPSDEQTKEKKRNANDVRVVLLDDPSPNSTPQHRRWEPRTLLVRPIHDRYWCVRLHIVLV